MSIKNFDWDLYARCYDALNQLTPYKNMLTEVASHIIASKPSKLLDASCGTGNLLLTLHEKGQVNFPSMEMLSLAKKKSVPYPDSSFIFEDLNKSTLKHLRGFSTIACINTLYALDNPESVTKNLFNILKPGGKLFLVTPLKGFENGLILKEHAGSTKPDSYWGNFHSSPENEARLLREAISDQDVLEQLLLVAAYNRDIATTQPFTFFSEDELRSLLKASGFTIRYFSRVYSEQDAFVIAEK
jgi:SAM-dependent methyltransferase